MDADQFDAHLETALRLCRTVAAAELPYDEMNEHIKATRDDLYESRGGPQDHDALDQIQYVLEVLEDVATTGASLPPEPQPIRVPDAPDGAGMVPVRGGA